MPTATSTLSLENLHPSPMPKLVFLLILLAAQFLAHAQTPPVSTITVRPWDLIEQRDIGNELKRAGFNHVTLYVPWIEVEPRPGKFEFKKFDAQIEKLREYGLFVILIIDFGGRPHFDDQGRKVAETIFPDWYFPAHLDSLMKNFSGELTTQINFKNRQAFQLTSRFVEEAIAHFSKKFGSTILGYAIGLQEEHELKYGQTGYQWRDYGREFQIEFESRFKKPPPVINYNNEVGGDRFRPEPLFADLQKLREADLEKLVCDYSQIIRKYGQKTIGYFGEFFTSHDAIYGGGIVQRVADCIDIAVVDFNFYDGYSLKSDSNVLPMMASYLRGNGYGKILIGAYGELWTHRGKSGELIPTIKESIRKSQRNPAVIGFEIGGFQRTETLEKIGTVDLSSLDFRDSLTYAKPKESASARIGILGSNANFYFWHGERSNERNIHHDALVSAYTLLSEVPDTDVVVIGENTLEKLPGMVKTFDAIVVPHQIALPAEVKKKLKEYWESGGILVQDIRLGEFNMAGSSTGDWLNDVFGIRNITWSRGPVEVMYRGRKIELNMRDSIYMNNAVLGARVGYKIMAPMVSRTKEGWKARIKQIVRGDFWPGAKDDDRGLILLGDRSLAFGAPVQLAVGPEGEAWRRIFVDEIMALIQRNRTARR